MLTIHIRGMGDPSAYHLETLLRERLRQNFGHTEICVHNAIMLSRVDEDKVNPYLMIEYSDIGEFGKLVLEIREAKIMIEIRTTKIGVMPDTL